MTGPGEVVRSPPMERRGRFMNRYLFGVVLVVAASLLWSLSGILLRNIEAANQLQLIFYRSAAMAATLLLIIAANHRGRLRPAFGAAGFLGMLGGACFAASSVCFIYSITTTTVASTVFLTATTPLFTAVLAWLILGERNRPATWAAIAATMAGVGIMMWGGIVDGQLLGNVLALGAAVTFAGLAVVLRRGQHLDMTTAMFIGGVFATIIGGMLADSLAISWRDLLLCMAMGSLQMAGALYLFVLGSRRLPAVEVTLISLIEVVLNPFWTWLGVGEVPSGQTLIGGMIVLVAIVGLTLSGARRPVGAGQTPLETNG
jgi:drug/metabolite transporter (DMT)-like permease